MQFEMKRLVILLVAAMIPALASAQAQINTKKVKISDFTQKTTMVVLTGNMFYDSALEDEIAARWNASPYGFCSLNEFEQMKTSEEYYFLLSAKGQFKKESEPGLQFLSLVKGGKKAEEGIAEMLEIVSLPIASADDPSGRESVFLPVFLDIIQAHALESMENDISGYTGLSNYSLNLHKTGDMVIVFSEDDLGAEITEEFTDNVFDEEMLVTTEDEADSYLSREGKNVVLSYVAVPTDAKAGSYCYKMLIDSQSHQLYYYKKHKITKKAGSGFLAEDINRIASYRVN